jgi:carbon-monoxide dehydrogenase medium subunit
MKPPVFEYVRPRSLDEALKILDDYGDAAKILAGGQSLVPLLNFRMLAPRLLVDINRIEGLNRIERDAGGGLRLGALVRWHQILADPLIASDCPVVAEAVRHVAHYQIRNRGTWAGSCAHAEPTAEFPAMAILCDAKFVLRSSGAERVISADEFFVGLMSTALNPNEILTEVRFPRWPAGRQWAFEEFAMRKGDFAIAGAAALLDGRSYPAAGNLRLVVFGSGGRASRVLPVENLIAANGLDRQQIDEAARLAGAYIDAQSDPIASAEYRRSLTSTLVQVVLSRLAGIDREITGGTA